MLVTIGTLALEGSLQIYALSIPTAWIPDTLVVVHALVAGDVFYEASVTLALEATRQIHAYSVRTQRWH